MSDATLRIVDCRFRLDDRAWGEHEYLAAHIPGAVYAHLDADLSGKKTGTNGRHPLPDAGVLAETFERLGIGDAAQVVAYDQDWGMYASRLWWLLRWLGHDAVAVLDGGFAKWIAEARPTRSGRESVDAARFTSTPRADMTVTAGQVEAIRSDPRWRLVDARAPERYRGEIEPIDRTPGHIPGAVNRPYAANISGGAFKSADALREEFHPVASGVDADHVVSYCGSGVTACHNLLALEHAGFHGAKLYPGSWSEWTSDPQRPVATSD